jgi:hypothetical protein
VFRQADGFEVVIVDDRLSLVESTSHGAHHCGSVFPSLLYSHCIHLDPSLHSGALNRSSLGHRLCGRGLVLIPLCAIIPCHITPCHIPGILRNCSTVSGGVDA